MIHLSRVNALRAASPSTSRGGLVLSVDTCNLAWARTDRLSASRCTAASTGYGSPSRVCASGAAQSQPAAGTKPIGKSQGKGHDRQRGIGMPGAREHRASGYEQVADAVNLTVGVYDTCAGTDPHSRGPHVVRCIGESGRPL